MTGRRRWTCDAVVPKTSIGGELRKAALLNGGPFSDLTTDGMPKRVKIESSAGMMAVAVVVETFLTTGYREYSSTSTRP